MGEKESYSAHRRTCNDNFPCPTLAIWNIVRASWGRTRNHVRDRGRYSPWIKDVGLSTYLFRSLLAIPTSCAFFLLISTKRFFPSRLEPREEFSFRAVRPLSQRKEGKKEGEREGSAAKKSGERKVSSCDLDTSCVRKKVAPGSQLQL